MTDPIAEGVKLLTMLNQKLGVAQWRVILSNPEVRTIIATLTAAGEMERELAEAREALKPFADLMDLVIGSAEENDFGVTATIQLTDLRRAARALKTIKPRI